MTTITIIRSKGAYETKAWGIVNAQGQLFNGFDFSGEAINANTYETKASAKHYMSRVGGSEVVKLLFPAI